MSAFEKKANYGISAAFELWPDWQVNKFVEPAPFRARQSEGSLRDSKDIKMRVVFETNVLVAAARSRTGASYQLISMLPSEKFQIAISIPLYLEYLDVLQRPENIPPNQTTDDVLGFVRKLLGYSHKQSIYFRWRPALKDPNDDFVLELANASQSFYIVTFNAKDFTNIELFGIETISPSDFMRLVA